MHSTPHTRSFALSTLNLAISRQHTDIMSNASLIGPHEGRELELMLSGDKPMAFFSCFADDADAIPGQAYISYIKDGTLLMRGLEITMPCAPSCHHTVMCSWPVRKKPGGLMMRLTFAATARAIRAGTATRAMFAWAGPWAIPKRPSPRSPTDANACERSGRIPRSGGQLNTQPSSREGENPKDKYQILDPGLPLRAGSGISLQTN